jgi:hypothetical protein
MNKLLMLLPLAALPFVAQASDVRVNVGIGAPAVVAPGTYKYGDRDKRGYYWDGNTWRDQAYWDKNQGKGKGNQGCPPGQAKKGNC